MTRMTTRKNQKHDRPAIKAALLEMARSGQPRPKQLYSVEGRFLSQFTCEGTRQFDAEFDQLVRSLRPDWFPKPKHDSAALKEVIRKAASDGEPRPTGRVGNAMSHYLNENCRCFDGDLKRDLYRQRPDWFAATRTKTKKETFLELARSGGPKPASGLHAYTRPASPQYDAVFDAEVRKLRPEWFSITDEAKLKLLAFAKNGGARPSEKNSGRTLYHAFRRYTRPEERYDAEFTSLLKATRPDWFAEPKRVYDKPASWRLV